MLVALSDLQGKGDRITQLGSGPIDQVPPQPCVDRNPVGAHVASTESGQEHNTVQLGISTQPENTRQEDSDSVAGGQRRFDRSRPAARRLVIGAMPSPPSPGVGEVAADLDRPGEQPRHGLPLIGQFDTLLYTPGTARRRRGPPQAGRSGQRPAGRVPAR